MSGARARLASLAHRFVFGDRIRAARRFEAFARAERASMLDLAVAARRTPSIERAALYLAHAADEARHAEVFARRASRELGAETHARVRAEADSEALFATLGEARFVAFVHHGERRGRAQFEAHARAFERAGHLRDHALLRAVLRDEARHEAYTAELLRALVGDRARGEVARAYLWELGRSFRRAGRALVAPLFTATMVLVYLLAAPLALAFRRASQPGFRPALPDERR